MRKPMRREFFKTVGIAAIGGGSLIEGVGRMHAQEKTPKADKDQEFAPGDRAPISGIYHVVHDKLDGDDHAQQHQVTVLSGTVFPSCTVCREWVRFRLYQAAEHVDAVSHFAK